MLLPRMQMAGTDKTTARGVNSRGEINHVNFKHWHPGESKMCSDVLEGETLLHKHLAS